MDQELGRHLRRFLITPEDLFKILQALSDDLPKDGKGVGIVYEPVRNAIELYVESDSFPLVRFDQEIPRETLRINLQKIIKSWRH